MRARCSSAFRWEKRLTSFRPMASHPNRIEQLLRLVHDLQPPMLPRLESTIQLTDKFSGDDGRLAPRGLVIGQLFTYRIDVGGLVIDVKKVARHEHQMRRKKRCSTDYACFIFRSC